MHLEQLHQRSLAYAATAFGMEFMHSVFQFYYVKVYLNLFHVSESWFQFTQICFLVWNAINDPLFASVQDNYNCQIVKSRRHSILYGAPVFALSFVIIWFPWASYDKETAPWISGLQMLAALCLYDTMYTFVGLAQCALFTEISHKQSDRIRLVRYEQMASLIGWTSVYFCQFMSSNLQHYTMFKMCCVFIALLSLACFIYTGMCGYTKYDLNPSSEYNCNTEQHSIIQQNFQIFCERNFISFVLMNFCQTYYFIYLANFASIICDHVIPDSEISLVVRNFLYGFLFVFPQIIVVIGAPVVSRVGYYRIIRSGFFLDIVISALLLVIRSPLFVILFFIVECASASAISSLFNLCMSDIIDEDMKAYHRKHPLSSMAFGLNALVIKPAISIAPMVTVFFLNRSGYKQYLTWKSSASSSDLLDTAAVTEAAGFHQLDSAMLYVSATTGIIVSIVRFVAWSFYDIRNSHRTLYDVEAN